MAKISCIPPTIAARITLEMSESEAAALDAIVGYGSTAFLKVFYEHLGKSYLQPYEEGLLSLFESVRSGEANVQSFLKRAKDARKVFVGTAKIAAPERGDSK